MINWRRSQKEFDLGAQRKIARLLRQHWALHTLKQGNESQGRTVKGKTTFTVEYALAAYSLHLSSLALRGFENCEPTGHVLLVRGGAGSVLQVEVPLKTSKSAPHVTSGPTADALENALQKVGAKRRSAPCQLLRVPSLHLSAVWVRRGSRDRMEQLVPYTMNFAGAKPGSAYTRPRFEKLLRMRANEMILRWYERLEAEQANEQA
jgi:hypothetical protein